MSVPGIRAIVVRYTAPALSKRKAIITVNWVDNAHAVDAVGVDNRIALLHPVSAPTFNIPKADYWIAFLVYKLPLAAIRDLKSDFADYLLFGAGSPAVVVISPDRQCLDKAVQLTKSNLIASDIWHVTEDGATPVEVQLPNKVAVDSLEPPAVLPNDPATCWLLKELWSNLVLHC